MARNKTSVIQPTYYAIIPAEVRYCNSIPPAARLLFGEIMCLANRFGYCYASNEFLGELYGVNPTTISEWIKQLDDKGFINSVVRGKNRKITINTTLRKKPKTPSEKAEEGASEKVEHNNTSINNNNRIAADSSAEHVCNDDPTSKLNTDIQSIIGKCIALDPINKRNYGNRGQRNACKFLLEEYGYDKIITAIENVKLARQRNETHFPVICTPIDLVNKWQKLKEAINRVNNEKK